jgi:hypothetical protein
MGRMETVAVVLNYLLSHLYCSSVIVMIARKSATSTTLFITTGLVGNIQATQKATSATFWLDIAT